MKLLSSNQLGRECSWLTMTGQSVLAILTWIERWVVTITVSNVYDIQHVTWCNTQALCVCTSTSSLTAVMSLSFVSVPDVLPHVACYCFHFEMMNAETKTLWLVLLSSIVNDSTCLFTHCLSLQNLDQYVLLVRASDLNGGAGGNAATGTVTVKINDVNDHVPTLEGPVRKYLHVVNIHKVLVCCCSACNLRFFHSP